MSSPAIPGSKSLTNRALLIAAAADGESVLRAPLVSDDTLAFAEALRVLGYQVERGADDREWTVRGTGKGPSADGVTVDCHDAGTAARFLPGLAAAGTGRIRFDGSDQLRRRPLRQLLDLLTELGARITPLGSADLPFDLEATGLAGGDTTIEANISSQFLSGLLMVAPLMREPLNVRVSALVSRPYVDMTIAVMTRFGVPVASVGDTLRVAAGGYRGTVYDIEPDASTASYFFAAAALTGTTVTVPGLGTDSLQGDLGFVDILRQMGATVEKTATGTTVTGPDRLRGDISVDMGNVSDTFMTLAGIAPYASGPVHIRNIAHARLKESDRIAAMAQNLRRCGIEVDEEPDGIRIHPGTPQPAVIDCHRDHRIAMSFSVLGLRAAGITLDDPACVSKTFPGFHQEFGRIFPAGTR